jgi:hypothetical protein
MMKILVCLSILFCPPEYLPQVWPGQVHGGVGVQGGQELHERLDVAGVDKMVLDFCAGVVIIVVILVQWD